VTEVRRGTGVAEAWSLFDRMGSAA
jgi:hypothetical protein